MKSSIILSLVVVAVIMLVMGATLGSVYFPATKTVTSTVNTTNIVPTTAISTIDISTTIVSTTVVSCLSKYPNGTDPQDAPSISIQENSTAYLCVRYYYYNPNSTMSLNASSVFGIAGYRQFNSSYSNGFDASPNFTISAFPNELALGGSQNLNEGSFVLYSIHAKSNSSGIYNFGFQATIYPSFLTCAGFSEIIVGSGSPDYNVGFGSCTAALTNSYPVNSEGFVNGFLTAEIVGITNSSST